jgi:sterol desaturase/sphingolipid hydroxylase (fatty acid hydroxylase superfamily)
MRRLLVRDRRRERVPPAPFAIAAMVEFGVLLLLERWSPLRPSTGGKMKRIASNAVIAAGGGLLTGTVEQRAMERLTATVVRRRMGLLQRLELPPAAETTLAIILLDYTLYLWHVLTHHFPALWRFHRVHHADRDLDVTTALRFHFGEMALSIPFRAAQVALIGVSPRALSIWQGALVLSIQFHHSNVRLPLRLERWLSWIVTTPRLHGIHHAQDPWLRNANWSSGLAIWDVVHRTRLASAPQPIIGESSLADASDVRLARMLALPFIEAARGP